MLLFCTPWKHQKGFRFSDVFREYRKATLGCNGLMGNSNQYFVNRTSQDECKELHSLYMQLVTRKHLRWRLFQKAAAFQTCNFVKKRLQHKCFLIAYPTSSFRDNHQLYKAKKESFCKTSKTVTLLRDFIIKICTFQYIYIWFRTVVRHALDLKADQFHLYFGVTINCNRWLV